MNQKEYKEMKHRINEESAVGVGFFDGIESKLPLYALTAATKEIASQGLVTVETSDAEANNILITEAIKQLNYQDFKEVAPYLFSYPTVQREQDLLVRPVEVSREYFEELQAHADELFQLKKSEKIQQIEKGIEELEMDLVPNGDQVIGVDLENETLLLLRSTDTAYIDDWEIRKPGLITDYRELGSSAYQTLQYLIEQDKNNHFAPIFQAEVLNRDKYDGFVTVDKGIITEVPEQAIPDFRSHHDFYVYAKQFNSFQNTYSSYVNYIQDTYNLHYPTNYGMDFWAEAILVKQLDTINDYLAKQNQELVVYKGYGYSRGEEFEISYLRDMDTETQNEVENYLEHVVTAYYRGSLTEAAVIPIEAIDPMKGYGGAVEETYFVDTDILGGNQRTLLDKITSNYPELERFVEVNVAKEKLLPEEKQKTAKLKAAEEELEL